MYNARNDLFSAGIASALAHPPFLPLIVHTLRVRHPMASHRSPLRLCAYIALFCLYAQAQVTGEGGPIPGVAVSGPPVTKTASLESGSPTNYYSSVHPHITLPRCVPAPSGL